MYLIRRSTLSKLEAVRVDGADHRLGEVRDLRGDADFARLVPSQAELSVSWVHLGPGQRLEPHRHPTLSAIIVAEGAGRTLRYPPCMVRNTRSGAISSRSTPRSC